MRTGSIIGGVLRGFLGLMLLCAAVVPSADLLRVVGVLTGGPKFPQAADAREACGASAACRRRRADTRILDETKNARAVPVATVDVAAQFEVADGEAGCLNTDNGATDYTGDDCTAYDAQPQNYCGHYDNADFKSSAMCCVCGGGELALLPPSPPAPPPPSPPPPSPSPPPPSPSPPPPAS